MQKLKTIDADTLTTTPLPALRFVVDGLIPQGLHILAGAPKIGKSWLALWLCVRVAKGESVWGFSSTQGSVLYLCLEDSYARIQRRLFQITEDAPADLHFANLSERIGGGLEAQLQAWLYYRLSKDDDPEQNSLQNQRNICRDFAVKQEVTIIGKSSDDNISGMTFSRPGLRKLSEAAERKAIDTVIVKDLSRLGRHKTQTALFIDFLRQQGIRVLSATEGLDTLEENDDLIIGVRGLMNDYYARDIGQKIRAGYRQKQKEGLVIIPPFGYWKDKNTGNIQVVPEAADTVRRIYQLYLSGMGLMPISRLLNAEQRKTPAQLQAKFYDKHIQNVRQYLWSYTSVKNILRDESYTGVLLCHQQEFKDGHRTRYVPENEQFRHENFYPPIILKEDWAKVHILLQQRQRKSSAGNSPCHRYAGLLVCRDCGGPFVGIKRDWNGKSRVEYICKSYMRHGKVVCPSHRIHEEVLDQAVWDKLNLCHDAAAQELGKIKDLQKCLALRKPVLDARRLLLQARIQKLEQEIDGILMEKALQHQNKS